MRRAWIVAGLLSACGGTSPDGVQPAPPGRTEPARRRPAAAPEADAGPPLDEGPARRLLAERFRAAGLRILQDVPVSAGGISLTADGFDRARGIGYEYVAVDEMGVELDDRERAELVKLANPAVLVVDAGSAEAIGRAADAFLAGLPAPPTEGQPDGVQ